MKTRLFPFFILLLFSLGACKKHRLQSNGLPPATDQGKNILGFMLNGQAWTPQGNNGTGNLSLYYDETFNAGVFNLSAYRNTNTSSGQRQSFIIYGDSIQGPQKISLPDDNRFGFSFWDEINNCTYSTSDSSTVLIAGYFDLQKLDKVSQIFSGEFELSFKKIGCKDIQITKGRFDMKY